MLFALVCAIGSAFAFGGLLSLPIGTEPWRAAVLGLAIIVSGFAMIEGGWLWIQREVDLSAETIVVRRWSEVLRALPGSAIPLGEGTHVSITLESVRSLRVERDGVKEVVLTLGYWEPRRVRELIEALRAKGVPFTQYWDGEYPPAT